MIAPRPMASADQAGSDGPESPCSVDKPSAIAGGGNSIEPPTLAGRGVPGAVVGTGVRVVVGVRVGVFGATVFVGVATIVPVAVGKGVPVDPTVGIGV